MTPHLPSDKSWPALPEHIHPNPAGTDTVLVVLSTARLVGILSWTAATLIVLSVMTQFSGKYSQDFLGRDLLAGLVYVGGEANLTATFSAALLSIAAGLLALIGGYARRRADRQARMWLFLSGIFVYLALDEFAQIHDRTVPFLRQIIPSDGLFHYSWVVLYAPLVLGVGLASLSFLRTLPSRPRWGIVLSGAIFVAGALGVELLEGLVQVSQGSGTLAKMSLVTLQEAMEMCGVILFIRTLFNHMGNALPSVSLNLNFQHRN